MKPMEEYKATCGQCEFFDRFKDSPDDDGECYRDPPCAALDMDDSGSIGLIFVRPQVGATDKACSGFKGGN